MSVKLQQITAMEKKQTHRKTGLVFLKLVLPFVFIRPKACHY